MEKLINGFQVRKVIAYKTREDNHWHHNVYDRKFLWWHKHYDYWSSAFYNDRTLEEILNDYGNIYFYKDGKLYMYPSIDFIFSSRHSETRYFKTDEEMFEYLEEFKQQFGKSFILV